MTINSESYAKQLIVKQPKQGVCMILLKLQNLTNESLLYVIRLSVKVPLEASKAVYRFSSQLFSSPALSSPDVIITCTGYQSKPRRFLRFFRSLYL